MLEVERTAVFGFFSGGPSAVHFAARYPERTTALLLDAAITLPYDLSIGAFMRATFESAFFVWLSYQVVDRLPKPMARFTIGGVADGLTSERKKAAARWITSHPARLQSLREQFASIAPKKHRDPGWVNDQANERDLRPLPFAEVAAPTPVAHGANDAVIPIEHATTAASRIGGAELKLVEEGHHLLSLSRTYGPVAHRQLELVGG